MINTQVDHEKSVVKPIAKLFLALIAVYRYAISPMLPDRCRFYPSCSCYADEAIRRYGIVHGGILAARRIGRCHPWGGHGVDLVPDLDSHKHSINCRQRKP